MELPFRNSYLAYEDYELAKKALRYLHDKGMEGHIEQIYNQHYKSYSYGIKVIWPEKWGIKEIVEFGIKVKKYVEGKT